MSREQKIARVIRILQRGRDEENTQAGGIAPAVTFTRYEVNEMITLLLDARDTPKRTR